MRQAHGQTSAPVRNNMSRGVIPLLAISDPVVVSDDVHLNTRQLNASSSTANNDRSLLGRLLNCRPCRRVIQDELVENVRHIDEKNI